MDVPAAVYAIVEDLRELVRAKGIAGHVAWRFAPDHGYVVAIVLPPRKAKVLRPDSGPKPRSKPGAVRP